MKLIYIGAGFVGTCSAAVMADSGHDVLVYDIVAEKIKKLGSRDRDVIEQCLFEKGLGDILVRNAERINFTDNFEILAAALDETDGIFMCLPTPEKADSEGESDLSYYNAAAEKLAAALTKRNNGAQNKRIVLINKSTVPINMVDETQKIMDF